MKYLLVNYEYPPMGGGAGNATWCLARSWAGQNHQVTVMTARHRELPDGENRDGVEVVRIPSLRRHFFKAGILEMASFMLSAMALAPALARKKKIDRVVVFFTIPCGPVGYFLKKKLGLPYLLLQRGGDVPGFEPRLNRMHKILTPIRRRLLNSALAVVANDKGLADLSHKSDPVAVCVVPNGVDTDFWKPAPVKAVEPNSGALRFLAVGRLVAQKNMFYLLDQFAQAVHGNEANFRLTVVGDGPDRQGLVERASGLGLKDRVHWLGWLSKEDLREEYQKADCLLNPSLYEGMPNVVLEAMACGLPAVVSNVPGNNTLVTNGENGFLCELNASPHLSDCLNRIAINPERLQSMGREARNRVARQYSWDMVAQSYHQLFESGPETMECSQRAVELMTAGWVRRTWGSTK